MESGKGCGSKVALAAAETKYHGGWSRRRNGYLLGFAPLGPAGTVHGRLAHGPSGLFDALQLLLFSPARASKIPEPPSPL